MSRFEALLDAGRKRAQPIVFMDQRFLARHPGHPGGTTRCRQPDRNSSER
jgi:hypothetical protein